ncbi:MAG: hypothetical protein E7650_01945 [Ruminococcaceae bacterium]|nr:hypothetical protein [Oscillospiraceae bacterium]
MMKNERLTISDLILIFKKRIVPILLAMLIFALGGFGIRTVLAPKYSATATFFVRNMQSEQLLLDYGLTSSQLAVVQSLAKEYAALACESDEFKTRVLTRHALDLTAEQLGDMIGATSQSATVKITATARDAATADAVIAAITAEFPLFVQEYAWPNLDADFTVVTLLRAAPPAARASWHPVWWGLVGGGLGLLLSYLYFILAFLFSDRICDAEEMARVLPEGLLLGTLPEISPPLDEGEAFFAVRERLPRVTKQTGACTLAVTSAEPREGKSFVAVGLARSLAVAGKRVLLIDADLRRDARSDFYLPEVERGLCHLLTDATLSPEGLVCASPVKGVSVLPAGHMTLSPCDVPFSERLCDVVASLAPSYDYIFVDFPALSQSPEAVASMADLAAVLLVSALGKTRASRLRAARGTVAEANGKLLGVIANHPPKSK